MNTSFVIQKYPGNGSSRKHLVKLYKINPRCCYCGTTTRLGAAGATYKKTPATKATIEHIYTKQDIRRCLTSYFSHVKLACYGCNQKRCTDEQRLFSRQLNDIPEGFDIRNFILKNQ